MTVNHFFVAIALVMAGIYFGFRPVTFEETRHGEIAQLDLNGFTIYEMDEKGLIHILHGKEGLRFADRYEVHDIAFIDSSEALSKELTADFGRAAFRDAGHADAPLGPGQRPFRAETGRQPCDGRGVLLPPGRRPYQGEEDYGVLHVTAGEE